MAAGAIRCVDVKRSPKAPPPMALVNMPEDVKPRAYAPCHSKELLAADILAPCAPVEHAMGRAMGDQDIDVRRNQVPLLAKLCAALEVEGHVKEPWLPGRAPKGHSPDLDAAVREIVVVSQAAQYPANWLFLHFRGCGESAYRFVVKDEEIMCSDAAVSSGSICGELFDRA